jgi:hypothetical protein
MPDLFANPVPAPHKTTRFWLFVALGLLAIFCTPLYMMLMGFRPFSLRIQIQSGLITLAMWTTIFWFGFRFGRKAWLVILPLMFAFVLFAWLQS